MPQIRPAAWINHALQDIDHAATHRDLTRLAQTLLGPRSFDLGVCYGVAENAADMVGSLLVLSKTFVLAGIYDAARMPTSSAGPLMVIHLEAEAIALFAGPAMRKAHDQRNELIREVGKAVMHPGELLGNAVEHYSEEYFYKWNHFQLLMGQTSLSGGFEAGRILGGVLFDVVLLISTIGDAFKAAKFLAEIPELVRLAKGLKEFGGVAGRLLKDETGAVRLGKGLTEVEAHKGLSSSSAETDRTLSRIDSRRILSRHHEAVDTHEGMYEQLAAEAQLQRHQGRRRSYLGRMTEAKGERAAAKHMRKHFKDFEMVSGFEPGPGIDQIWVKRGPDGKVVEVMVVEAKGPGAGLSKGQMTKKWLRKKAKVMCKPRQDPDTRAIGQILRDGLKTHGGPPRVRGIVLQATDEGNATKILARDYN